MRRFRARNRRRRPFGQRLGAFLKAVGGGLRATLKVAFVLAFIAALPIGIYQGYQALLRAEYFVVTAITIEGNHRLSRDAVLELAGLSERRNIFALDADRMTERLEANPWIVWAFVDLELPRTVRIEVREREAAGWIYFDGLYRIDTDGFVIERGRAADMDGPLLTGIRPVWLEEVAEASGPDSRLDPLGQVRRAMEIGETYRAEGLDRIDALAEIHFDELVGFSLLTRRHRMEIRLGYDRFAERLGRLRDVIRTLEGESLEGRYILLDAEGALTRVAVGPARPGRGGRGPYGGSASPD